MIAGALDLELIPLEFKVAGDRVGVAVEARARGTASGAPVGTRFGYVFEVRDGEMAVIRLVREAETALATVSGDDPEPMDISELKARARTVWGLGDYSLLSRILEPAARELADACAVSAGQEVLDVAAGDGNFAVAAAREGASVIASDLSPGMVERGRRRSEAEGLGIEWVEADAEELPFEDGRFDCVGSVFGAFLAPRPDVVAGELARVTRPGGAVGMATWGVDGYQAELFALNGRWFPRPESLPPPIDWGREAVVRSRFDGLSVEIAHHSLELAFATREELSTGLAQFPTHVAAQQTLSEDDFATYQGELLALVDRFNEATDGSVRVPARYLVIVARKRG